MKEEEKNRLKEREKEIKGQHLKYKRMTSMRFTYLMIQNENALLQFLGVI